MPGETTVREAQARMAANTVRGVYAAADDLLGEAQRRAPVEEGTLRGSGSIALIVNGTRFEGASALAAAMAAARLAGHAGLAVHVDAEVSFNTVYAARQHEETTWQHPKGGQAKYLSQPLAERAGRYETVITAAANHPGDL